VNKAHTQTETDGSMEGAQPKSNNNTVQSHQSNAPFTSRLHCTLGGLLEYDRGRVIPNCQGSSQMVPQPIGSNRASSSDQLICVTAVLDNKNPLSSSSSSSSSSS
jgi:hypothetical protein